MTGHLHQPIVFPDAEAVVIGHLGPLLDIPVTTSIPNSRPAKFLRVMRTGGPATSVIIDQAQLTFEAWGDGSVDASNLARQARAAVNAMPGRVPGVQRVAELSGPGNLPDPHSSQARYSWNVIVHFRGVAA
jgi:hypothetical protein